MGTGTFLEYLALKERFVLALAKARQAVAENQVFDYCPLSLPVRASDDLHSVLAGAIAEYPVLSCPLCGKSITVLQDASLPFDDMGIPEFEYIRPLAMDEEFMNEWAAEIELDN